MTTSPLKILFVVLPPRKLRCIKSKMGHIIRIRIENRLWMQTWQQNWQIISSSKMMKSLGLTWYSIIIYTDTFSPLGQRVENEKTIINVKVSLNIQRGRDHGLAPYTRFEHPHFKSISHQEFPNNFHVSAGGSYVVWPQWLHGKCLQRSSLRTLYQGYRQSMTRWRMWTSL